MGGSQSIIWRRLKGWTGWEGMGWDGSWYEIFSWWRSHLSCEQANKLARREIWKGFEGTRISLLGMYVCVFNLIRYIFLGMR
jgi:hypothetical protein